MQISPQEILKIVQKHRDTIRGFGVRRLGLFGSWARGEANDASDMDFVVELEKKTFDSYMDVKMFLEDLFHCRVDLVLSDTIKPRLRNSILQQTIYVPGI